MKTWMWAVMLCLVVLVSGERARAGWPSLEQPAPRAGGGERDVALVISIEDYAVLPDVEGAEANAQAWVQWFERTRGVRPDRVVHLKNNEGTPKTILSKAAELFEEADSGGMIWVVFIGHGAPSEDEKEGVLVGWAAQQTAIELYANSLRQSELLEALGRGDKAPITLVVDACFSGKAGDGTALAKGLQPVLLANREATLPKAVTVLSAGRSDQFAGPLPGTSRPAFSYLLLGAMRGWGDDKDSGYGNGDGQVTTDEAVGFAKAALRATLKGRSQTPEAVGAKPVLSKKASERAPDLSKLKGLTDPVDATGGGGLGGGAGSVGGGLDLSNLDLEALGEAQRLKEAIDRAKAVEGDKGASAQSKAEAWEAVATLRVKGSNPYAEEARRNASSWRAVAGKLGELRENWVKLKEALKLSVLNLEKKKSLVGQFLGAYPGLSSEREYKEAESAKRALDSGNALPFGMKTEDAAAERHSGPSEAARNLVSLGVNAYKLGDYRLAHGYFSKALEAEPSNSVARAYLSRTADKLKGEPSELLPEKLSATSVRSTLKGRFAECGRLATGEDAVTVMAEFVVASDGKVIAAGVIDSEGVSRSVQDCVVEVLRAMNFERFSEPQMMVRVPIRVK